MLVRGRRREAAAVLCWFGRRELHGQCEGKLLITLSYYLLTYLRTIESTLTNYFDLYGEREGRADVLVR